MKIEEYLEHTRKEITTVKGRRLRCRNRVLLLRINRTYTLEESEERKAIDKEIKQHKTNEEKLNKELDLLDTALVNLLIDRRASLRPDL